MLLALQKRRCQELGCGVLNNVRDFLNFKMSGPTFKRAKVAKSKPNTSAATKKRSEEQNDVELNGSNVSGCAGSSPVGATLQPISNEQLIATPSSAPVVGASAQSSASNVSGNASSSPTTALSQRSNEPVSLGASTPGENDSRKRRSPSRGLNLDKIVKYGGKMRIVFNPGQTIPVDYVEEFAE